MFNPDRRLLLAALSASLLPKWARAATEPGVRLGPPTPFRFETVVQLARKSAARPWHAPAQRAAHLIKTIDFDAVQKIGFRPDFPAHHSSPKMRLMPVVRLPEATP